MTRTTSSLELQRRQCDALDRERRAGQELTQYSPDWSGPEDIELVRGILHDKESSVRQCLQ
jgi:hypothetical protein